MELVTKKRLHLFSGRANRSLASEIASHLGVELGDPGITDFANGEIKCRFQESVRGGDVFIIQSHASAGEMSVNDAIMEQLDNWGIAYTRADHVPLRTVEESKKKGANL